MGRSKRLITSTAWQHRRMILNGADMAWVVWPVLDGRLEDYSLVVAFALTFRLDTIAAGGTLLSALDAAFPARKTASLGSLPHLGIR
jgi:hypothetical protein